MDISEIGVEANTDLILSVLNNNSAVYVLRKSIDIEELYHELAVVVDFEVKNNKTRFLVWECEFFHDGFQHPMFKDTIEYWDLNLQAKLEARVRGGKPVKFVELNSHWFNDSRIISFDDLREVVMPDFEDWTTTIEEKSPVEATLTGEQVAENLLNISIRRIGNIDLPGNRPTVLIGNYKSKHYPKIGEYIRLHGAFYKVENIMNILDKDEDEDYPMIIVMVRSVKLISLVDDKNTVQDKKFTDYFGL